MEEYTKRRITEIEIHYDFFGDHNGDAFKKVSDFALSLPEKTKRIRKRTPKMSSDTLSGSRVISFFNVSS